MWPRLGAAAALLLTAALASPAITVSRVATFHNAGLEVLFESAPAAGTTVTPYVRDAGSTNAYRQGHALSRIADDTFAGSLFGLQAGASYSVRLESAAFPSNLYVSVTTRSDAFPAATNRTFHVNSASGSDSNGGLSSNLAFRTLGHALTQAQAGDTVLLHEGRYYEGDLSAPRSGTPAAPIVFRAAPGESPVLDGTDTNFMPAWSLFDAGHQVYRTTSTAEPMTAFLNGGQLYHYLALDDLSTNRWEQPGGYHADGSHIYVRFPGGQAPGTNRVTIPRYTTGIALDNRACLQFVGLEFGYYGYGEYHRALYIDGGDSNLVDRCSFHHCGLGVAFKRAANFNTVQYCRFTEWPVTTWSWHAVKEGGVGYEAGGVVVYASSTPNEGNVVRYCTFTNMFDASNLGSDETAGPTRNMDFHDNLIVDCRDDAIELDGVGVNNRVYRNRFHGFLTGISVAPCAVGPTYIFRNVLSAWHDVGDFPGYPFKFNVTSPLGIEWLYLYHNTCYTDVAGQNGFLFKQYSRWTNVVSRNNIYAGTDYAIESWSATNPVSFDYDNLYTTHGSHFIRWAGASYASVAAFHAATGQEPHGVSVAPAFVDADAGNWHLAPASPLIDRGVLLPGINDDYVGQAPDLGALEFAALATNAGAAAGSVSIHWQALSGTVYRLQATSDLFAPSWSDLGNPVTAAANRVTLTDPTAASATQRYYRAAASRP